MKQLALTKTPEGKGTLCLRVAYPDGFDSEYVTKPLGFLELAEKLEQQAKELREADARL